jgi:hypothetical protein
VQCGNSANNDTYVPPPTYTCGDNKCTGGETCSSCAKDCGVCPAKCGDGICNGAETCATCSVDCKACAPPTTLPSLSPTTTSTRAPGTGTTRPTPPQGQPGKNVVVGYYTNWAQYRSADNGKYKFFPENIDLNLFTHIMYGFGKVTAAFELDFVEWNGKVSS